MFNPPKKSNLAHTTMRNHWSSLRAVPSKWIKDDCIAFTEMKVLPCPCASPYEHDQLGLCQVGYITRRGMQELMRDILPRHLKWNSSWLYLVKTLRESFSINTEISLFCKWLSVYNITTNSVKLVIEISASTNRNVDGECHDTTTDIFLK